MTKDDLRSYRHIKQELDHLRSLYADINAQLYGTSPQGMDGMPHGTPAEAKHPSDAMIDRKIELVKMYESKQRAAAATLLTIETAISDLDPRERDLVRLHYIDGKTWEQVCVDMGYSWRQIHRIHAIALAKLQCK